MSSEFWSQVLAIVVGWKLPTILLIIGLDWVFGVLAALRIGTFDWDRFADVYRTNILPWLGGYLVLSFTAALISLVPGYFDLNTAGADFLNLMGQWGSAAGA